MLQIKTITAFNTEDFDKKVNEAMLEGWRLTKRERTDTPSSIKDYYFLYAELERDVITLNEIGCENCRYSEQIGGEPCDSCDPDAWDKWEPKEGAIVMVPLNTR